MVVLALETVTRRGSVAIWIDGVCHARVGESDRTHAERLPSELVAWAEAHDRTLAGVDLFAVVSGPGSFTGLRVGIAAIQGLALPPRRRVVPISTFEALTAIGMTLPVRPDLVAPCIDGQRGEVFYALFDVSSATTVSDGTCLIDASVGRPELAAARIADASPSGRRLAVIGDGATRYDGALRAALPDADILAPPAPLADAAARLAALRAGASVAPYALRPVYVRRPDAVIARDRLVRHDDMTFTIRRAEGPADFAAVEALQRETFTNPWGAEAIRWELEHTDVARLYVMNAPGGDVVAYCACWIVFDELHINSLAVHPAWRRRGLARKLLTSVFAGARADGAQSATLEVRGSNDAALRLYEGLGFRVEAVRRDYYQEPREDALILWNRALGREP